MYKTGKAYTEAADAAATGEPALQFTQARPLITSN